MAGGRGWISLGTTTRSLPRTKIAPALFAVPVPAHHSLSQYTLSHQKMKTNTEELSLTAIVRCGEKRNQVTLSEPFKPIHYTFMRSYNKLKIIVLTKLHDTVRLQKSQILLATTHTWEDQWRWMYVVSSYPKCDQAWTSCIRTQTFNTIVFSWIRPGQKQRITQPEEIYIEIDSEDRTTRKGGTNGSLHCTRGGPSAQQNRLP